MSGRVIVFDLDGTLIDSAPGIARVLNAMRAEQSLPPCPIEAFRDWISLGAPHLVAAALDCELPADAVSVGEFRARYSKTTTVREDVYSGVEETLLRLQEAGVEMGVCSNKPHALCEKVLSDVGLRSFFRAVLGGDSVSECKPHPMHLEATLVQMGCAGQPFIYVGDSIIDAEAALAARAEFLWASYGYGDPRQLAGRGTRIDRPIEILRSVLPSEIV